MATKAEIEKREAERAAHAHELSRWHATSAEWTAVATYLRGDVNAMNAVRLYGDAREQRVYEQAERVRAYEQREGIRGESLEGLEGGRK